MSVCWQKFVMKQRKYRNIITYRHGFRFDSKLEASRYDTLSILEKAGKIRDLVLQPVFHLSVRGIRLGKYIADFSYYEGDVFVVEDVKGVQTPIFKWKSKHLKAEHGIEVKLITRG